ncbi:MAG: hypothetical protein ABF633_03030 [Clostridium sp.]|uniref:DUF6906 family protein n=1 Tax=Clostridium sp. TaxID=1506 RepID=UPI0039E7B763
MKHGKRLILREKILLEDQGYDPEKYLRTKRTAECLSFVNIETGVEIEIRY